MTRMRSAVSLTLLPSVAYAFSQQQHGQRQRTARWTHTPSPALTPSVTWTTRQITLRAATDDLVENTQTSPELDMALGAGDLKKSTNIVKDMKGAISREQWQQIFELIEETTANAEENTENLRELAEFPMQSTARAEMTAMYKALKESGQLQLFGAVDTRMPLAAGSTNVPPPILERILDLPMTALTPKPNNSLLIAGVGVALLEGFLSAFLGIPLNALVAATLLFVSLDRIFLNGALFETLLKAFSPGVQDKILKHEAGHFLAAYLLGCPVEGIVLSAWAALQDRRFGTRQVSAGTSFFDPELSKQINNRQSVTRSSVDRYSIIVMAGIAAEADNYGRADGGAGDEMSLVAFLSQLNADNARSWDSDKIRNQARWGALQAVLMLREYKPAFDALVDALERGGSLGDCIFAIEKAARQHGLEPLTHPLGYVVEKNESGSMGIQVQTVAWEKFRERPEELASVKANPTLSDDMDSPVEPKDEETLSKELQQYRELVEGRLKDVEQRLNDLN
mmetsp:Transcript_7774/g.21686  ORF Transcript_7774/g.21686 Transcript_7774/m.21686 type:complete len:510 (+) Transcript_7774:71-1600(+)